MTASAEAAWCQTLESQKHNLAAVKVLESKLNVARCWTLDSMEWQAAAEKVSMWHYQHCIDALEGLIVARMFELMKMNMSQTGKSHHIQILSYTNLWLLNRLQHAQAHHQCPESSLKSHLHCPRQVLLCCSHPSTSSTTPWLRTGGWVCLPLWLWPPLSNNLPPTCSDQCWSVLGIFFWSALISVRIADQCWAVLIRLSNHWVTCTKLSVLGLLICAEWFWSDFLTLECLVSTSAIHHVT